MDVTRYGRGALAALVAPTFLVACGEDGETSAATTTAAPGAAAAAAPETRATLAAPDRSEVGTITFTPVSGGSEVDVRLVANKAVKPGSFHGIHVHANGDPANGAGCQADSAAAPATWFTSADGHLNEGSATHTDHKGDLPSVLVHKDGSASLRFTTDRFTPAEVVGKAVIVHVAADNFGNVPTGNLPDQYKANAEAATTKTKATGNAGDRAACGVIGR